MIKKAFKCNVVNRICHAKNKWLFEIMYIVPLRLKNKITHHLLLKPKIGTLWCGYDDLAPTYDSLGPATRLDRSTHCVQLSSYISI